ncbi:polysaccharide export outer membrane protein [Bacteroidia bacterium]|nr:polysaccharide export outer membrane protein [Bacteroidia bacterium]GHT27323.1 polysaccharide export outer membrane protein [Bacteroidia bacterium]GHV71516.1 polysaccharide export outer membrane protein [Bacteroidia bacterium]
MKYRYILLLFPIVFLFSCKSTSNSITYFDDLQSGKPISKIPINTANEDPVILPNNVLLIIVSSANALDTKVLEQFNLVPLTTLDASAGSISSDREIQSYTVDKNGNIFFPILGKIKVQDLTVIELQNLLMKELSAYLTNPIVTIQLSNNRVKVLGEVLHPGFVDIENNRRYSILDAIAFVGDITVFGDKKAVKLFRETDGEMESVVLDLTSSDIFASPYFYLKQNDIIVIDPNKTRKKDSKFGVNDNYKLSVVSTVLSSISLITSTVITIISIRNK